MFNLVDWNLHMLIIFQGKNSFVVGGVGTAEYKGNLFRKIIFKHMPMCYGSPRPSHHLMAACYMSYGVKHS